MQRLLEGRRRLLEAVLCAGQRESDVGAVAQTEGGKREWKRGKGG